MMTIGYELEWYHRIGDEFVVDNVNLETTEFEVRRVFGVSDDEIGDCLKVEESHVIFGRSPAIHEQKSCNSSTSN